VDGYQVDENLVSERLLKMRRFFSKASKQPSSNIGAKNMSRKATATKPQSLQPLLTPSAELQLLNVFVGKWPTEGLSYGVGQSKENPYFNGQIGDLPLSGIETIGYDAASQTYPAQIFDNYGRIHVGQRSIRDGVWSSYIGTEYRAKYTFRNDGKNMATHWEWLNKDNWSVLMDLEAVQVN
jgi:hypothetical protein